MLTGLFRAVQAPTVGYCEHRDEYQIYTNIGDS
jgi:hypothetical protein